MVKGSHHTEEAKQKNRLKHLGKPNTSGYKPTAEMRARIGARSSGKQCTFYKDGRCNDPDYVKWIDSRTRGNRGRAMGSHTYQEWQVLLKKYGKKCLACGKTESETKITIDHVIPLSRGGTNYIENIQLLCLSCNDRKWQKTIDYRTSIPIFSETN